MKKSLRYLIPMILMAAASASCAVAQNAPPPAAAAQPGAPTGAGPGGPGGGPAGAPGGAPGGAAGGQAARPQAPAVPAAPTIVGIAQVTFKASDLEKSRVYYNKVLGLPQAFEVKDRAGKVTSVYYKVNDEQFIEIVPGLQPGDNVRQARVVIQSSDLPALREEYVKRGLNPGAIAMSPEGNPTFRITLPNGFPMDFMQYAPNSKQGALRGKLLTPERISTHLLHVGTRVTDEATRAFFPKLGLSRPMGTRGDYLETPNSDSNLLTKNPPLDPNNPATRAQYEREVAGSTYHFSLEMEDPWQVRETVKARGGYDDVRMRTAVGGGSRRWLIHVFDPDGTRTEFMSKDPVPADLPGFSVLPPGPRAEPIRATQNGVYPWP